MESPSGAPMRGVGGAGRASPSLAGSRPGPGEPPGEGAQRSAAASAWPRRTLRLPIASCRSRHTG